jgi:beta-glucosidase
VSVLQGLRERLGERVVSDPGAASATVVVVGLGAGDEGESYISTDPAAVRLLGGVAATRLGSLVVSRLLALLGKVRSAGGDREDLHLHPEDVALIASVSAVNPRTVVVVVAGGTVMFDPWDQQVGAILMAWYPGMEGGRALADILLGDAEPGGRLPVAIPRRRADLPILDWHAKRVTYGRWWGQRKLDRDGVPAAYPFGFGMGYTTWQLHGQRVPDGVEVSVANTGARDGRHVVQVYSGSALVAFAPVRVAAGGSATLFIAVPDEANDLRIASHAADRRAGNAS